ncbi:MAG: chemotaxis protein CheW [Planctomycetota bacterium]
MTSAAASRARRWCSFVLGNECFAVEAGIVVEVLRSRRLTRVPLAARGMLGLIQLRGRIVPVIDPAEPLAVSRRSGSAASPHLVIAPSDDWYGLLVDEMLDVIEIEPERVERPTAGMDLVQGTFAAADRLVHLLDPERMIQSLTRQRPVLSGKPSSQDIHGSIGLSEGLARAAGQTHSNPSLQSKQRSPETWR